MTDLERLRDYIASARKSGVQRLPPEPRLSEQLGVTRGRLRTLLKRVESDGLIWRHVGKGTFVGSGQPSARSGNLSSRVSVDDIIQARLVIEPPLAGQAAIHSTPADLDAMDACLREMAQAQEFSAWRQLDAQLHSLIAEASHNALLALLHNTLRGELTLHLETRMQAVFSVPPTATPRQETESEHSLIVEAIRSHDPRLAERLMLDHIRSVRTKLFGQL